ncbi:MAG: calcium/sodium antiporter [Thermoanaerobaculia bacterium]|nr:calcium/sodium antiporter [Thermoanaerobaculia bacterium]
MTWEIAWLLLAGIALLTLGAETLVRGASRLAALLGISPLVIGLTVVAFATSAPEMAVSVRSALGGQADLALGNVVGSNILNVLLILGLSAVITPLVVAHQLVRLDVPLMIGASLLLPLLAWNGRVDRWEGLLLVAAAGVYTALLVRLSRREGAAAAAENQQELETRPAQSGGAALAGHAGLALLGLGLLVAGARLFLDAAVALATAMGVSELVVALTVVAAGTSLPEIAASVVAAVRGERDIAVGNVVGSNLFNLLWVLGGAAAVGQGGVAVSSAALRFDIPVMVAVAIACLPIFANGHRIARWEGFFFLTAYLAYTAFVVLAATEHDHLPAYSAAMRWFVLPLVGLTLGVVGWRAWRARGGA